MNIEVKLLSGSVDGFDREATGIVLVDNVEFKFVLCTDDGMTSIEINDESIEYTDVTFNGASGFDLYEAILLAVDVAGLGLQDNDEE